MSSNHPVLGEGQWIEIYIYINIWGISSFALFGGIIEANEKP